MTTPLKPSPAAILSMSSVVNTAKVLIVIALIILGVVVFAVIAQKNALKKSGNKLPKPPQPKPTPSSPVTMPANKTTQSAPVPANTTSSGLPAEGTIDHVFFLKPSKTDVKNNGTWVMLATDDRQIYGYYHGLSPKEGFVKVSGVRKIANGRKYIDITDIKPAA